MLRDVWSASSCHDRQERLRALGHKCHKGEEGKYRQNALVQRRTVEGDICALPFHASSSHPMVHTAFPCLGPLPPGYRFRVAVSSPCVSAGYHRSYQRRTPGTCHLKMKAL